MENTYPPLQAVVSVGDVAYRVVDLPAMFGKTLERLPVVLRLLLENTLRNTEGRERQRAVEGLLRWLETGTSEEEIAFQPARVLMHDTTSTPALVDIAAMRDALAEAGADPAVLNPVLPVDVSVDHSLAVEYNARADAAELNLRTEMRRNAERYRFLRWASKALRGVRIHPPGTGIMHTINLEQLATVASVQSIDGVPWLVPDTLIGTDSHTPMINGIGVLGWGVGGLEAQTVMFGMPVMQRIPDVIGVRLLGALAAGTSATDLALTVTQALRDIGVSGEFVEFFGPGVAALSAGERAVVANMAPEYGATTGFFPVDARTLDYLRATGRPEAHVARVEALHRRAGLWFDPHNAPRYTRVIEIDLAAVRLHVAGPRRPQDLLPYTDTGLALSALGKADVDADVDTDAAAGLPAHPVAIAAITSCTNTSDPAQLIAAGLVARRARERGLRVPDWVKTSLAPGSPAAAEYLRRAGLIDDLSAVGFDIVGFGCTTCIGNSGPLTAPIQQAIADGTAAPVAVLSGNRNFPGRVHPDLSLGFIMSPPLVIAFALAGDAARDLSRQPLQAAPDGTPVHLRDLWPTRAEIDTLVRQGTSPADYRHAFAIASANPAWAAIDAPDAPRYPWDAGSTALRRPPFASADAGSQLGDYEAYPLLVLGDDITTDHISPASAIPKDSFVADFLVARGGRSQRPQRLRLPARQLGSDGARGVLQQDAGQSAGARPAGGAYAACAQRAGDAGLRGRAALSRRRRIGGAAGGGPVRHGLVARLGGQGAAPARCPGGHCGKLRAHSPFQPDRHGHPAAAVSRGDASADAGHPAGRYDSRRGFAGADRTALRGARPREARGRQRGDFRRDGRRGDAARDHAAALRRRDPRDPRPDAAGAACRRAGRVVPAARVARATVGRLAASTDTMKHDRPIATQIVDLIQADGLEAGAHLPAQMLADRLRVSRSPVNEALALLHEKGILMREKNRGYFVARAVTAPATVVASELGLDETDLVSRAYFQIADDRLKGVLPDQFSEQMIRTRYGLTTTQLNAVLGRIAQEGWAERKPGYGWAFSTMLTTPDSLLQSYRLRLALEPAALLEPGYRLDPRVIERLRAAENHLLAGGIETDTADQLHDRGVRFHESLVEASGNAFFIDTIRRVNRVRRLLSYRSMQHRERYPEHARQHLHILDLLARERNEEASDMMRAHLRHTLDAIANISSILEP